MNVRNGIDYLTQTLPSQTVTKAAAQPDTSKSVHPAATHGSTQDQAQVSTAAAEVAKTSATSDVRLDKVASIQSQLQAGTYHVPASAVAQKVIASMLDEGK